MRERLMRQFFSDLSSLSALIFGVASMLSIGFGYPTHQILQPLRNARRVMRALIANFVLVPLLALVAVRVFQLDGPLGTGLFLLGTAGGAPFLIMLTMAAGGDVARSASLLLLLLSVTIVYMPIVVPLVSPGITVSALSIAMPLFLTMLLPLGIGLFVHERYQHLAQSLHPIVGKVALTALVALVLTTLLLNLRAVLTVLGSSAILAALFVIGGAFVIGYALGLSERARTVLGLGTAQRNVAAATVVATQSFDDPGVLVMVVVASVLSMLFLFLIAWILRKRSAESETVRRAA
jgi:BASS family bile acid:Na+ symporter